ncbi:hypothetical protein EV356DRAFT_529845 [Viridothelium virens]|uniref:Uncharacterized protein n=1 Tax=Viridothelium virens TaxID=1048519 RepID=A0A6A6HKE2_VIRVR|nr:hypothetical protein EV356DRAFT_529845 [Viridothelium virens]
MPVHPNSEHVQDALAAQSKDTKDKGEQTKATAEHHQANPGPVVAENLPDKASKEELKKKAEELNK